MSGIKIGFIAFIEEISIHKTFEPACTQSFSFRSWLALIYDNVLENILIQKNNTFTIIAQGLQVEENVTLYQPCKTCKK